MGSKYYFPPATGKIAPRKRTVHASFFFSFKSNPALIAILHCACVCVSHRWSGITNDSRQINEAAGGPRLAQLSPAINPKTNCAIWRGPKDFPRARGKSSRAATAAQVAKAAACALTSCLGWAWNWACGIFFSLYLLCFLPYRMMNARRDDFSKNWVSFCYRVFFWFSEEEKNFY